MKVLSLVVVALLGVVLVQSDCPPSWKESDSQLEGDSDALSKAYASIDQDLDESSLRVVRKVESSSKCPDESDTDVELPAALTARSKRAAVPAVPKSCEPCPSKQVFLRRFYKVCWVLFWNIQQVRYVTCPGNPYSQQCTCQTYRCNRTHYVRVWFLSWCAGGDTLPSGYTGGLNYNYLWLPQECTCRRC
ncbi:uncharacterized protein LOC124118290 [Haliotis rufescens]|uniref:uncharacterized protein LOC124118290 n=1 Tax=Haliotis rufescens TaxID=6454 RepID=UPI001EAFD1AA|nr:uncharacterized protein LOC124118290 [Haliotis rufescens]